MGEDHIDFPAYFARSATAYRAHRPTYPPELFGFLASLAPSRERAWNCGAGSGQASAELCRHFRTVVATDMSLLQLRAAEEGTFARLVCTAEHVCLGRAAVDLVTVTQALHWFDLERFYAEVRRVARPGGVLAVVTYSLPRVAPDVDRVLDDFYVEKMGAYWHPQRRHVDSGYADLPFPFDELPAPPFRIALRLSGRAFLAYLGTWSAVCRARDLTGRDPLEPFAPVLEEAWGSLDDASEVCWPLHLRVGRVVEDGT